MKLRRDTEFLRRTVPEQGRMVIVPEIYVYEGVPEDAVRRVSFVTQGDIAITLGPNKYNFTGLPTPENVRVYMDQLRKEGALAGVDDAGAHPADIASGRPYQWPEWPSNVNSQSFHIRAVQWMSAISLSGNALLTLIVEYLEVPT